MPSEKSCQNLQFTNFYLLPLRQFGYHELEKSRTHLLTPVQHGDDKQIGQKEGNQKAVQDCKAISDQQVSYAPQKPSE